MSGQGPEPNLRDVDRRLTNQDRLAVVRAWRAAQAVGERQPVFCARQSPPVSTRTLRAWLKGFSVNEPPVDEACRVIDAAIERLRQLRDILSPQLGGGVTTVEQREHGHVRPLESRPPYSEDLALADSDAVQRIRSDEAEADAELLPPASSTASITSPKPLAEADPAAAGVAAHGLLSEAPRSSEVHMRFRWEL